VRVCRTNEVQEVEDSKVTRIEGGKAAHPCELQCRGKSSVEDALTAQAEAFEQLESAVQQAGLLWSPRPESTVGS
jgi:hypothetical protein